MQVYVVEMWLTCQSSDPDILNAFDARWTPARQRDWATLAINAGSPSDLAVAMNAEIYRVFSTQIASDLGIAASTGFDGIDCYTTQAWNTSSIKHLSSSNIVVATKSGVAVSPWTFPAPNNKRGTMYAACQWTFVTVIGLNDA